MYGIKENQEQKLKKYERFKSFRVKSCRSTSLPVKNMASGAPRGHITTGIFSTDKVGTEGDSSRKKEQYESQIFTLSCFFINSLLRLSIMVRIIAQGTAESIAPVTEDQNIIFFENSATIAGIYDLLDKKG